MIWKNKKLTQQREKDIGYLTIDWEISHHFMNIFYLSIIVEVILIKEHQLNKKRKVSTLNCIQLPLFGTLTAVVSSKAAITVLI
jgi:hypothetical protein